MTSKRPQNYEGTDLKALYERLANREPFQFDLQNSALYRQYRDEYQRLGRQAMTDTMGRASGLTGGYASTYSETAGQQAYNAYLQELNRQVPELYDRALEEYRAEGDNLQRLYDLEAGKEERAYNRWQDEYNRWLQEAKLQQEEAARAQAQENWEAEQALQREKWEYQKEGYGGSGGSGGSKSSGSSGGSKSSGSSRAGSKSAKGKNSETAAKGGAPEPVYTGGVTESQLQTMAASYKKNPGKSPEAFIKSLGLTGTAAERLRALIS